MSLSEDYGHFLILGAGLVMLGIASKRKKPRNLEDRSGEKCDPEESAPFGYQCGQVRGGWELMEEQARFIGFGPYTNRQAVDRALDSLGFPNGDLVGFQKHMSLVYAKGLRVDGEVDKETMAALKQAENMLARNEWLSPKAIGRS